MRTLIQDLRYGFRMARSSPGFTLIAVATLAIGIAANTTVFSWIDAILLHPIPGVAKGEELVSFEGVAPNGDYLTVSYPDYRDYRDHIKLLAGLAVAKPEAFSLGDDEHAERIRGELVSGNYFAVLGVKPVLGRFFSAEEYGDKQGGYPVAVISERLWKRRFHSDPRIAGSTIRLNRQTLTVIGVAPADFHGSIPGLTFEIWAPVMMGTQLNAMPDWMLEDRGSYIMFGFGRLKPGVSLDQARQETASVAREVAKQDYKHGHMSATLFPVWKGHFGVQTLLLAPLTILMAVGAVVLLIVCANVANLLLARATSRQKELSMRMALGAGRGRLVRQLLTETLGLAMMGAVAALPLTMWMSQSLGYMLPPTSLPVYLEFGMNGDILAFTVLLCVGACLVSGVAPAWQTASASLNEVLKEGGRSGNAGSGSHRLRGMLVVSEVALALVVVIAAALFARSFQMARQINPGFDPQHVLVSRLYLSTAGYSVPARKQFCQRLRERVESQPGIVAVSYADQIPLTVGGSWEDLRIEGYVPGPGESMKLWRNVVSPGYFDVLRIPLLEGRDFTEQDDMNTTPVMVVTQTFARRYFGDRDPIGRKVHGWGEWFTIVGVVRDSKYGALNEAPRPHFYVAFRQVFRADLDIAFFVRTKGDPLQALPLLQQQVKSMDPGVGVYYALPMAESVEASLFEKKIAAALLAALGSIALVLAAVGLYGVMAYSVSQRTQEIGIRMALGARPRDVWAMTVGQGMRLTLIGLAVGVVAALAVTRLVASLLVHVSASDPLIFIGAALFLAAVALLASYLPARRATRIDPNEALRCQ
jgi:predicted permease